MQNKRKLINEIELVTTIKKLAQAYEEISVIKMEKIRSSVLSTREFLTDLSEVFVDVKANYQEELVKLSKRRGKKNKITFSMNKKNGKTVSVLISSNAKLYGDVIKKVFYYFMENITKDQSDIVLIGKLGKELFDQEGIIRGYNYFELPDIKIALEDLKPIVSYIVNYEKVHVYYGKFMNVVSQTPTAASISGEQHLDLSSPPSKEITKFFFEPSLEQILNFFENQVFISLFKQSINESELSRLASRIKAMEDALTNVEKRESILKSDSKRFRRITENKQQFERLAGISLWTNMSR